MGSSSDGRFIGQPLRRVEDRRLIVGAGRYVDDLRPPGVLHVAFLRCPHAHARIERVDVEAARAAPGVIAVLTGADTRHLGPMTVNPIFPDMKVPPHPILAEGIAHAAGVPIAAVAAASPYLASDAVELIGADYTPQPALVDPEAALASGAPALFPALGTNRVCGRAVRQGDPDAAFASAERVVRLRVSQPRLASVALEPRAVLAAYDPDAGELTIWASTQAPFRVQAEIARLLALPEGRVRVIAPDVGGGFGPRTAPYREDVLVAYLAVTLGRPVKWVATRSEDLLTTYHGRGAVAEGALAVDHDGRIRALSARIVYALGTSLSNGAAVPVWNHARLLPGAYLVPACDIDTAGALTTAAATAPYRGAGRPEATFLIERLVEEAARALGLDAADLRRRNFIPPDRFPFRTATGQVYDSGDYPQALERALERARYRELRQAQAEARARGELVGVGLASYVEPCALGWESGSVRVERTGAVTAVTGSSPHGQGHETTFAQVVADFLGAEPAEVTVRHGDTRAGPAGFGTFGSRSVALGGSALAEAARVVRDKGRRLAARLLEADPADVVPVRGGFHVAGVAGRRVSWRRVADLAYGIQGLPPGETPGLEASAFFQAEGEVWSFGSVVASVQVERETGAITLRSVVWVDDAGTIVNPLLAEGQLHGGFAQGLGQALWEEVAYDADGQLLTGTLMEYAVPRAADVPQPVLDKTFTPSPRNPLGAKGLGEAGCIAIPPAIVNAVVDALAPFGVTHLDMPLTAEKVWRALQPGQARP
jgi:carbon-monoxide dehydrogenase large subunit